MSATLARPAAPSAAIVERLQIVLVGNFVADGQESMLRFARMLQEGLAEAEIPAALLAPESCFGALGPARSLRGKWLGYVDKFVLFPWALRRGLRRIANANTGARLVVHICDHSNAPYVAQACGLPCVVTCHDLGAVRGARGEPTWCPASPTGKLLQRWILTSLGRAQRVVCDSSATQADLHRLLGIHAPRSEVVFPGLNQPFARRVPAEMESRLAAALPAVDWSRPFVLHVGSNLARKNRDGVLRILQRVGRQWNGQLVFAGARPSSELENLARELGVGDRVIVVERPETPLLEALYNRAFALLFPSRFEGFGWPVIEAQACGCPVLCSDAASLPEVAGAGALLRPVEDEAGFAEDLLSLADPSRRAVLIARGFENVARFDTRRMIARYVAIYRELAAAA